MTFKNELKKTYDAQSPGDDALGKTLAAMRTAQPLRDRFSGGNVAAIAASFLILMGAALALLWIPRAGPAESNPPITSGGVLNSQSPANPPEQNYDQNAELVFSVLSSALPNWDAGLENPGVRLSMDEVGGLVVQNFDSNYTDTVPEEIIGAIHAIYLADLDADGIRELVVCSTKQEVAFNYLIIVFKISASSGWETGAYTWTHEEYPNLQVIEDAVHGPGLFAMFSGDRCQLLYIDGDALALGEDVLAETPAHVAFDLPELVKTLPQCPDYIPAAEITPLTNQQTIYLNCITGRPAFIRKDMTRISLPSQAESYCAIRDADRVIGYALIDNNQKYAVMDTSGKIITDFDYTLFSYADYWDFPALKGYVMVCKTVDGVSRFGVLDMRTGEEVIRAEYDSVSLYDCAVVVTKGDRRALLDYSGNIVLDGESISVWDKESEEYSHCLSVGDAGYTLVESSRELYRRGDSGGSRAFISPGGEIVAMRGYKNMGQEADKDELTVYSSDGGFLTSVKMFNYFGYDGKNLIVVADGRASVFYTGARNTVGLVIPLSADVRSDIQSAEFSGGRLVIELFEVSTNELKRLEYDERGTLLKSEPAPANSTVNGNVYWQGGKGCWYQDERGEILIGAGRYESMTQYGRFVRCANGFGTDSSIHIYNDKGELLLENPYGAVFWENGWEVSMVVWLDADTCMLMKPDGSMMPITDAPKVERIYYGG